jgi:hypothetical protein
MTSVERRFGRHDRDATDEAQRLSFALSVGLTVVEVQQPWRGIIKDAELDNLVAYVVSLKPKGEDLGF